MIDSSKLRDGADCRCTERTPKSTLLDFTQVLAGFHDVEIRGNGKKIQHLGVGGGRNFHISRLLSLERGNGNQVSILLEFEFFSAVLPSGRLHLRLPELGDFLFVIANVVIEQDIDMGLRKVL